MPLSIAELLAAVASELVVAIAIRGATLSQIQNIYSTITDHNASRSSQSRSMIMLGPVMMVLRSTPDVLSFDPPDEPMKPCGEAPALY